MSIGIIFAILLIIIAGFWFLKTRRKTKTEQIKTVYNKEEAESFVKHLDELGYFKYADSSDLDDLKKNMIDYYDPNSELTSIWDDNTGTPKDYRYYDCGGEDVFEQNGITGLLEELKPTFEELNFRCDITNHFEKWDEKNNWLNHRITINGTEYIIFKNFTEIGWGEAPKRIAEILNMELSKQEKDER